MIIGISLGKCKSKNNCKKREYRLKTCLRALHSSSQISQSYIIVTITWAYALPSESSISSKIAALLVSSAIQVINALLIGLDAVPIVSVVLELNRSSSTCQWNAVSIGIGNIHYGGYTAASLISRIQVGTGCICKTHWSGNIISWDWINKKQKSKRDWESWLHFIKKCY